MPFIARYQKITNEYTTFSISSSSQSENILELCDIDGYTYISVPDESSLIIPTEIKTYEKVVLTEKIIEDIRENSSYCKLIDERVIKIIRDKYTLDDELYLARISCGVLLGTYTLLNHETNLLRDFQVLVEGAREWGRQERIKIGLSL